MKTSIIHEIEREARANSNYNGHAERTLGSPGQYYLVECTIVSAMINRGMATGDTKRATWKINGQRASYAACLALAEREAPREVQLVPTWVACMPILIAALENGTDEGKRLAREELMDLAKRVDTINSGPKPVEPDENIGSIEPDA